MRVLTLLLVTGTFVAAPASSQFYPAPGPGPHRTPTLVVTSRAGATRTGPDMAGVLHDIHEGTRQGQLSHREARELRLQADEIRTLEQRYGVDGLSDSEAAELNSRLEALRGIVNAQRSSPGK
jgi:hypothetical protein